MTKKKIKAALKAALKKEYIVALSIFAEYIAKFDEEEQEEKLYKLDDVVWEVAEKYHATDEWLEIFSALQMSI